MAERSAQFLQLARTQSARFGRFLGQCGRLGAAWSIQKGWPAARVAARASGRAFVASLGWLWRQRSGVANVLARVGWWASAWLAWRGGLDLFDLTRSVEPDQLIRTFGTGLALCAGAIVLATHGRVRWGALGLGLIHGVLAMLTWTSAHP